MRDPARIPKILERIERLWMESPDLRLGQLLYATCPALERHLFNTEDDVLEQALERYEQERQQKRSEKTP